MKIATLFVAGVVLMPAALADDAEDVKKAVAIIRAHTDEDGALRTR